MSIRRARSTRTHRMLMIVPQADHFRPTTPSPLALGLFLITDFFAKAPRGKRRACARVFAAAGDHHGAATWDYRRGRAAGGQHTARAGAPTEQGGGSPFGGTARRSMAPSFLRT